MRLALVLNRKAGTLRGTDPDLAGKEIADIFRSQGHDVEVEVLEGDAVFSAIKRICAEKSADALVIGGGDGTVSAAAAQAAECGITLGVLPLGTMNLFARSLGVPLEMRAAAEALATARIVDVDIGEVNGRLFVHLVTIGLHADMIAARKRIPYGSRLGKIWASCKAWWFVVRQPPRLKVLLRADALRLKRRTAAVLISNNPLGEGHLPYADDPRRGLLGLYIVKSRRPADLFKLTVGMMLGRFSANAQLDNWQVSGVEIRFRDESMRASVDGEIVELRSPIRCRLHPGGLRVLRPIAASEKAGAQDGSDARARNPVLSGGV